jgi:hypothetical protein
VRLQHCMQQTLAIRSHNSFNLFVSYPTLAARTNTP